MTQLQPTKSQINLLRDIEQNPRGLHIGHHGNTWRACERRAWIIYTSPNYVLTSSGRPALATKEQG